ncbi:MAG TPA: alpha/beta fold hydrolase, partial [Thermoanaerobaculia bacterium]|nr:alpha/beta fold hydrolase [Thermoanaerobaculia bacterium]
MSPRSRALALAAPLLASLACGTARLAPQVERLEGLRAITGRAVAPAPGTAILVAVLAPEPAGERVVHYDLASAQGDFLFVLPPGRYRLAAFADANGDFSRGADEPAALRAIEVRPAGPEAAPQQVGEIVLSAGAATPALDLTAWGPEAGPDRARRIGEIVALDDPRFAPDAISTGLWEPLGFAGAAGMRLFFLAPHDQSLTPVVFVHGMLGSPRDFAPLVAALDRERFEPWLLYYPSGLSLDLSALFLAEALEEASRRLGVERLHVVAHSMGGLVSRAALDFRLRRGRSPLVEELVTLSTPWGGAEGARGMKLGVALAPAVAPSWRDML